MGGGTAGVPGSGVYGKRAEAHATAENMTILLSTSTSARHADLLAAKCNVQEKTEHMALREHHGTHNFKKDYRRLTNSVNHGKILLEYGTFSQRQDIIYYSILLKFIIGQMRINF